MRRLRLGPVMIQVMVCQVTASLVMTCRQMRTTMLFEIDDLAESFDSWLASSFSSQSPAAAPWDSEPDVSNSRRGANFEFCPPPKKVNSGIFWCENPGSKTLPLKGKYEKSCFAENLFEGGCKNENGGGCKNGFGGATGCV